LRTRELVLTFHGLGEPPDVVQAGERPYWWRKDSFARLLHELKIVPPSTKLKIAITFDDGNASDALIALPELAKNQLTASFFICAGRIGSTHYLDVPMIRDLLSNNMNIGSHGMNHQPWIGLSDRELEVEISDARRKLEDVTGTAVNDVAIPFGLYNRSVLTRLRKEPWRCIYTSDRGLASVDSTLKPRETIYTTMQGRNILQELLEKPSMYVLARRHLSGLYKRLL
jgi:peptidoglycan/xylan/chitin deacetylase (PgdA/CDA1 family)